MQALIDILTSPVWWLSVVIVGLGVNLAAAYLKPRIDHWAASFSRTRADRIEERRLARAARINTLRDDTHAQVMTHLEELRYRIRALQNLMSAFFVLSLAAGMMAWASNSGELSAGITILGGILGLAAIVGALLSHRDTQNAVRIKTELWDAEESEVDQSAAPEEPDSDNSVLIDNVFGDKVRSARLRLGLTQEQLATKLGLTRSLISRIERGLTEPSSDTSKRIAKLLQFEPSKENTG